MSLFLLSLIEPPFLTVTPGVCHKRESEVHQTTLEILTTGWNQWPALDFGDQDNNLSIP